MSTPAINRTSIYLYGRDESRPYRAILPLPEEKGKISFGILPLPEDII